MLSLTTNASSPERQQPIHDEMLAALKPRHVTAATRDGGIH
jgi:hypothetical protein